jgi:hypothetical protein
MPSDPRDRAPDNPRVTPIGRAKSRAAPENRGRRSEYDVTDTVRVSSADEVREAVTALYQQSYPGAPVDSLWIAFHDFRRLFAGEYGDYLGCDTIYHDRQHTLDMTLAMARLIAGYERSCAPEDRLGETRALMGLVTALFHDSGYVRRERETQPLNGAEYTKHHVSRSAAFLSKYLAQIGLPELAPVAAQVVHFTGYEISLDAIELEDPRDSIIGHLLGTADLMAQMADRCYLEKCRDRLYAEFVLGGVATQMVGEAVRKQRYESGIDLLRQTPQFYGDSAKDRLERIFNRAYRYVEPLFEGRNPYLDAIEKNLAHLDRVIAGSAWEDLRRSPPCFTALAEPLETVSGLVSRELARTAKSAAGAGPE